MPSRNLALVTDLVTEKSVTGYRAAVTAVPLSPCPHSISIVRLQNPVTTVTKGIKRSRANGLPGNRPKVTTVTRLPMNPAQAVGNPGNASNRGNHGNRGNQTLSSPLSV